MATPARQRPYRAQPFFPPLLAAVGALLVLQAAGTGIRGVVVVLVSGAVLLAPRVVARWRMRRLLVSGDAERVIGTWEDSIQRLAHSETMAPLLRATAYAAYGWVDAARRALDRARRGPAWEAAYEQRLFVETLLDTFEGDREAAIRKATVLERLPMPNAGPIARRRIALLRGGIGALARSFAHCSRGTDARLLARAAAVSPLVHWAMRYAAAVVAVDEGRTADVAALLAGAPAWPQQSAFQAFHSELLFRAAGPEPNLAGSS